jgi:hypothetical protein
MQQTGASEEQSALLEHSSCVVQPHWTCAQSKGLAAQHTGVAPEHMAVGPQRTSIPGGKGPVSAGAPLSDAPSACAPSPEEDESFAGPPSVLPSAAVKAFPPHDAWTTRRPMHAHRMIRIASPKE